MAIVTREGKGSKLTIAEMDGNLTTLNSQSFQDGVYSQLVGASGGEIISFDGFSIDGSLDGAVSGSYTVTPTGGSGTGAEFELVIISDRGKTAINTNASTIIDGGSGYLSGDSLSVLLQDLGGTPGTESISLLIGENSVNAFNNGRVGSINVATSSVALEHRTDNGIANGAITGLSNSTSSPSTIDNAATGSYTVTISNSTGDGSGAVLELVIIGIPPSMSIDLENSSVIEEGSGYAVGDALTIYSSDIGGTEGDRYTITLGEGDVNALSTATLLLSAADGETGATLAANSSAYVSIQSVKQDPSIIITSDGNNSGILVRSGSIGFIGDVFINLDILPTEDPIKPGQLWNDSGSLKISLVK